MSYYRRLPAIGVAFIHGAVGTDFTTISHSGAGRDKLRAQGTQINVTADAPRAPRSRAAKRGNTFAFYEALVPLPFRRHDAALDGIREAIVKAEAAAGH